MKSTAVYFFEQIRAYALMSAPAVVAIAVTSSSCQSDTPAPPQFAYDVALEGLKSAAAWENPPEEVVLSLASHYFATRREEDAFAYFSERVRLDPNRALFLALQGVFQARMSGQVTATSRVAWVEEGIAKLDQARALDGGLARLLRAVSFGRLPSRFGKTELALNELRWLLDSPDSILQRTTLPSPARYGLRRGCIQSMAFALHTLGRETEAEEARLLSGMRSYDDNEPTLASAFSVSARDGFRFSPPVVSQPAPNVYVASGYDFADIAFVVTTAGVVTIDAGTTTESMARALSAFRKQVPDVPIVKTFLTHAHWDHIGGIAAIKSPGLEIIAQAGFSAELKKVNTTRIGYQYFFGQAAANSFDLVPDRLISTRTELTVGNTRFVAQPIHGGETDDALLITLPDQKIAFVGDAFMPYIGAPFAAEGSAEGLLDTIDVLQAESPTKLVHGHLPLSEFYTVDVLPALAEALRDIRTRTLEEMAKGRSVREILELNMLPEALRKTPKSRLPFLLMRDQFIARIQRERTGYWQPDGEGIEPRDRKGWVRVVSALAGDSEVRIAQVATDLLARGDLALALELTDLGLASFPASVQLIALRHRALDGLREKNQVTNPFKFIVYSEMAQRELPQLAEVNGVVK
jgi:glyoxylase-like metal-dependent hydrolase (beta-lactamase superfamily II)